MKKVNQTQKEHENQSQQSKPYDNSHSQSQQMEPEQNNSEQGKNVEEQKEKQESQQGEYEEYDQYGEYEEYGEYGNDIIDEISKANEKKYSSQSNSQCQMEDLVKMIDRETEKVIELTGFNRFWALIYYQACGWKMNLVSAFIDEKKSSHQMISYKPGSASLSNLSGTCDVCCLQQQIILRNMCGDEFCENCWKEHLTERMKIFNSDPFPPCLNAECNIKTSPFILEEIQKTDSVFKKLYLRTLCRSYAIGNTSVKMCKGKEKFSCDRCFKINKLFEIIECEYCQNLVCGRCGQEYHMPSECFQVNNWRKVVEESTSFVQRLNYRICPYCKEAVERSVGCNSVVCKCKQMFCYICGQKWLPNHSQHGVCYKEKEIKALDEQRRKKCENQKEYIDKLEKFKAQVENYQGKIRKIDHFNVEEIRDELITRFQILSNQLDYLDPLRKKLKMALIVGKNYLLSLYFNDNEIMKAQFSTLASLIDRSYDYLLYKLQDIINAYTEDQTKLSTRAMNIFKEIKENKGYSQQEDLAKGKIQMLGIMKNFENYFKN